MIRRRLTYLKNTLETIRSAARDARAIYQALLRSELDRLRSSSRYDDPKHLIRFGNKAYAQCDEDGILAEIFHRIGTTNKVFVEFGIGNGLENNTLTLLFDGWSGLWIDASTQSIAKIKAAYSRVITAGQLKVIEAFINRDNIDDLIKDNIEQRDIDLLSIDIDGNDYHVLKAITSTTPRVIAIEYNAKFPPPILFCMEYDESHTWSRNDCFGASLKFLEMKLSDRGYCLVACNLAGSNAFFVRSDLARDKFYEPFSAENHFEPARYHLVDISSGHPASYATLAKSLSRGY